MRKSFWLRSAMDRMNFLPERSFDELSPDEAVYARIIARSSGIEGLLLRLPTPVPDAGELIAPVAFSFVLPSIDSPSAGDSGGDVAAGLTALPRALTALAGANGGFHLGGNPESPADIRFNEARYLVLYSEDLQSSLVVDAATGQLLTGGAGDHLDRIDGRNDTLHLSGDFSGGVTLPNGPSGIDVVQLGAGSNFTLAAGDGHVARGASVTISGTALGPGDWIDFDGSAETDGQFVFHGGAGADRFTGGEGDDLIYGLGGGDVLRGGGGSDIFAYTSASESTGAGYDTLADFDPSEDLIDIAGTVAGFGPTLAGGALSTATFDDDLSAALGASGLPAGSAIWFAPDEGDLAGKIFLIVDGNGEEGYQAGEDYVFAVEGTPLPALGASTDFFV